MTTTKTTTTSTPATPKTPAAVAPRKTYLFHYGEEPMFVDLSEEQVNLMEFLRQAGFLIEELEWEALDAVVRQAP